MKHTPTPWQIGLPSEFNAEVVHSEGRIGFMSIPRKIKEDLLEGENWLDMRERTKADRIAVVDELKANAELIVRAVNSHAALVSALETLLEEWNSTCDLHGWDRNHLAGHDMAIAALKLAKGE